MWFFLRLQLCLLALLCISFSVMLGQNAGGKFIVGVLQENGAIIPFARYDGTRWLNTWPAPVQESRNTPPPLTRIPQEWLGEDAPQQWRLWLPGGTVHAIRATGPKYFKDACGENWGLNADFPPVLNRSAATCPLRATGIVVSTSQELISMRPADQSERALEALEKAAAESEIGEMRSNSPLDPGLRTRFPLRVERAWSVRRDSGEDLYYIEANRRLGNLESDPCYGRFNAFRGWTTRNSSRKDTVLTVTVRVTDCDFKGVDFVTPMGLLQLKGESFVIAQVNGWDSQSYAILKIGSADVTSVLDSPVR